MKTVVAYRQGPELLPSAGLVKANHAFNFNFTAASHVSTPLLVSMEAADGRENEDYGEHIVGDGCVCSLQSFKFKQVCFICDGKKDGSKEITFICRGLQSDLGFSLME
ncbi:hypothetical protein V6N13_138870 [Hibiscus sabdariffa]